MPPDYLQVIGSLSYENGGPGVSGHVPPYKRTFAVDPNSVVIQRQKDAIHLGLRLADISPPEMSNVTQGLDIK